MTKSEEWAFILVCAVVSLLCFSHADLVSAFNDPMAKHHGEDK